LSQWQQADSLDREKLTELLADFATRWLAHDGLWFQAAENDIDIETAMKLDTDAWRRFSPIEAKRIKKFLGLGDNPGLEGLIEAVKYRLYAFINEQAIERIDEHTVELKMVNCRVQSARQSKDMDLFPCKSVGIVEYTTFAETIDSRIKTECMRCVPDEFNGEYFCRWRFTIKK
jgi:Family of unknown function (DUF6125)